MKNNFCIYVHTNKTNGKKYIGQTSNIKNRWCPSHYEGCTAFYRAIQKYGWNNFTHQILIDNLTKEDADILQEAFIKKYRTREREFGYNIAMGGSDVCTMAKGDNPKAKKVICLETQEVFDCGVNAAQKYNISKANIYDCCKGKQKTAAGLHWSWYEEGKDYSKLIQDLKPTKRFKTSVVQIETGRVFQSATAAGIALGVNPKNPGGNITSCCRGKLRSAYGYHWKYAEFTNDRRRL